MGPIARFAYGPLAQKQIPPALVDAWLRAAPQPTRAITADTRKLFVSDTTSAYTLEAAERFDEFDRPALLIWGGDDRFFQLGYAERLAAADARRTRGRDRGRQDLRLARPARRVAEAIAAFMGETATARSEPSPLMASDPHVVVWAEVRGSPAAPSSAVSGITSTPPVAATRRTPAMWSPIPASGSSTTTVAAAPSRPTVRTGPSDSSSASIARFSSQQRRLEPGDAELPRAVGEDHAPAPCPAQPPARSRPRSPRPRRRRAGRQSHEARHPDRLTAAPRRSPGGPRGRGGRRRAGSAAATRERRTIGAMNRLKSESALASSRPAR